MIFDMTKRKGGGGKIVPLTAVTNGTYDAEQLAGADGFNPVTVNVPTGIQPPTAGWLPSDWYLYKQSLVPQKITFYGNIVTLGKGYFQILSGYGSALSGLQYIDCDGNCRIMSIDQNSFSNLKELRTVRLRLHSNFALFSSLFSGASMMGTLYLLADLPVLSPTLSGGLPSTIQHIYVSWGEGEVAGAPWGATNATIHYNYTED